MTNQNTQEADPGGYGYRAVRLTRWAIIVGLVLLLVAVLGGPAAAFWVALMLAPVTGLTGYWRGRADQAQGGGPDAGEDPLEVVRRNLEDPAR